MINYIILAISVSIDSLGIGITYGIKNTKLFFVSKAILFVISIFITSLAVFMGNIICSILPNNFANYIGIAILILLGFWIIYQSINTNDEKILNNHINHFHGLQEKLSFFKKHTFNFIKKSLGITIQIIRDPILSDLDGSKKIDWKESLYLGIALSLDSIGVGIGGSIAGLNSIVFPVLVASFQLIFLSMGIYFGKKIISSLCLPKNIWSVISGILLIFIGIFKLYCIFS